MSTPNPPSADQLALARLAHWRQNAPGDLETPDGTALLTLDSARRFVSTCGLLLFAPRPQHISSPAPSFVEATLGAPTPTPTLAQSAEARTLLARLIAEGSAVPLNLLGAPSTTPDAPDFIASAATFPYIFTLRGDKAFKQPPSTSGATKVSPLALNTYTLLVENGPTSAYDLATQLGKEVTEAAVLRSLNELWQHLRVLPVPQPDGGVTLWETVANRFTKQLKAGANAGQPTALSALISLYLSQALLATESDVETFLSPLAPRSRVRDVLHALTGARQLETIAVDGKTHLHIHGELPAFASQAEPTEAEEGAEPVAPGLELADDGTRIKKFVPKPRKVGTGYVEKARPFGASARTSRPPRPFDHSADRPAARSGDRPGRPARPAFNKPWDEERQQRASRQAAQAPSDISTPSDQPFQDLDLDASSAPPSRPTPPAKRPFAAKARFGGDRPAFTRKPTAGGDRPAYSRGRDDAAPGRPPRRDFAPREGGEGRPPRREFSGPGRPAFGDRKPSGGSGFGDRRQGGSAGRPGGGDRPQFGAGRDRGPGDRGKAGRGLENRGPENRGPGDRRPENGSPEFKARRPFRREETAGAAGGRPPRREFTPRAEGTSRPQREGFSKPRSFRDRPDTDAPAGAGRPERPAFRKFDAPRKPFPPRDGGDAGPARRDHSAPGKPPFSPRKPFTRSGEGQGSAPREGGFSGKREGGGYAGKRESGGYAGKREGGSFGGKKSFGPKAGGDAGKKPFGAKPGNRRGVDAPGSSTFDKFKGGNKPWGKRPPGRKPKPDQGDA